jgi:hypothetical protein
MLSVHYTSKMSQIEQDLRLMEESL